MASTQIKSAKCQSRTIAPVYSPFAYKECNCD